MSIPDHIIEQLTDNADLVSIIGKHVELKKSGADFKGCCPFHGEKTPSFHVRPNQGYYHCFGCKVGGNAIRFLMDYEGQTFLEALETLSQQTGISLPKSEPSPELNYQRTSKKLNVKPTTKLVYQPTASNQNTNNETNPVATEETSVTTLAQQPNIDDINDLLSDNTMFDDYNNADYAPMDFADSAHTSYQDHYLPDSHNSLDIPFSDTDNTSSIQEDKSNGNLYELLDRLSEFYQQQLKIKPKALMYFNQRGLKEDTMNAFGLGFAPSGWQHLQNAFPQDIEGLKILGLVRTSDKPNSNDYCLLRDRVIFPIKDHKGRIVGFGGRTLDKETQPKYINSPESVVFRKQFILYGLYEGRKAKAKEWLMVEGYMDVIALHQAGIYGSVASMGTATNTDQIKKLFKQNPKLTLAFDGDIAGRKAAWRTLEISLPALLDEYELRFLILPENEDPDSLVNSEGANAMADRIANAPPLSEFLINELANRFGTDTPEGKSQLMSALKKLLTNLPEYSSYRRLLTNEVKEKLGLSYKPFKSNAERQAEKAKIAKYRDTLLNFDSKFSFEELSVYHLLIKPSLVDTLEITDTSLIGDSLVTRTITVLKRTRVLATLGIFTSLLEQTLFAMSMLQPHYKEFISSHELNDAMDDFIAFIQLTEENSVFTDLSNATWLDAVFHEIHLMYQAQTLKKKLATCQTIYEQKAVNEKLTEVRKLLQFREQQL